jgi:hypothetical protein
MLKLKYTNVLLSLRKEDTGVQFSVRIYFWFLSHIIRVLRGAGIAYSLLSLGYELDNRTIAVLFPAVATHFSLLQNVQTGTGSPDSHLLKGLRYFYRER